LKAEGSGDLIHNPERKMVKIEPGTADPCQQQQQQQQRQGSKGPEAAHAAGQDTLLLLFSGGQHLRASSGPAEEAVQVNQWQYSREAWVPRQSLVHHAD
jgi:hypothetical protein